MPRSNYIGKLTHEEIISLFDAGAYSCNLETGIITSTKTGNEVFTYCGSQDENRYSKSKRDDYLWIRVYKCPSYRTMPVAHLVWIIGTRSPIPPGFEIHHWDEDRTNNSFINLYCLHNVDHRKLHKLLKTDKVPF